MPTKKRRSRSGSPHAGLPIPAPLRREAAALLDQQFWCWGLDIRRPEGNALIAFGFRRVPVADGNRGSNAYVKELDDGPSLALWGSGLALGHAPLGALAVGRFDFRLSYDRSPPLGPAVLSAGAVPDLGPIVGPDACGRAHLLAQSVFDAIASYEAWAADALGPDHRRRCVESWPKRRTPADRIVHAWRAIADRWRSSVVSSSEHSLIQGSRTTP